MRRDFSIMAVLWVVVTLLAVLGTAIMNPFPTPAAEEADTIDHAFRIMTYMATPVFGLVVALLIVSIFKFRTKGTPELDGPPIRGTGTVPRVWFAITTALAVLVMIFPGLTGLSELRADQTSDLEINVQAFRFGWLVQYPEGEVTVGSPKEMVLPADQRVRFNVTSVDVLHSFWIPAFRQKIDAVPGQTTVVYVTPTDEGSYEEDAAYRIQCAELCGVLHSAMTMPVRVVSPEEFQAWLAEQ
ncbi:MAG: cytochrome c oxidase subunit II [Dehalococcoidia bacterium]